IYDDGPLLDSLILENFDAEIMKAIHTLDKMNTRFYAYLKSEFLAAYRDYIEKFQVVELSQELITT
ncbi:unnamed protein product, partial [Rotaria sordida]